MVMYYMLSVSVSQSSHGTKELLTYQSKLSRLGSYRWLCLLLNWDTFSLCRPSPKCNKVAVSLSVLPVLR